MLQEPNLNVNLFLRLRPYMPVEYPSSEEEKRKVINIDSDTTISFKGKIFHFDKIFDIETPEKEIFTNSTANLLNNALNGKTCTVICYGYACTGKTKTIEQIISNTMKEIFKSDISKYTLEVSFYEYHLDEWIDILNKKRNLKVNNGTIEDLTMVKIDSFDKFNKIYSKGKRNQFDLHQENNKHKMNSSVYNSHSILTLNIFKDNNTLLSKIFFIDLMSWAKIDSSCSKGLNFKEISSLNNSLLNLEDAIKSLAKKQIFIPKDKFLKVIKQCFDNDCYISFIMHCANLKRYKNDINHTLEISEFINRL